MTTKQRPQENQRAKGLQKRLKQAQDTAFACDECIEGLAMYDYATEKYIVYSCDICGESFYQKY